MELPKNNFTPLPEKLTKVPDREGSLFNRLLLLTIIIILVVLSSFLFMLIKQKQQSQNQPPPVTNDNRIPTASVSPKITAPADSSASADIDEQKELEAIDTSSNEADLKSIESDLLGL